MGASQGMAHSGRGSVSYSTRSSYGRFPRHGPLGEGFRFLFNEILVWALPKAWPTRGGVPFLIQRDPRMGASQGMAHSGRGSVSYSRRSSYGRFPRHGPLGEGFRFLFKEILVW